MKKVLILTVTAGNAHNACAKSMKDTLERMGDVEVKIVDILKAYSSKRNVWVADGGYNLAVSKLLPLYNTFYEHYRNCKPENRYTSAPQHTILSVLNGLMQEILSFKPDVIYSTHFYGAIALTDLRLVYDIPCKVVVTALDYVLSPFWESGIGVDNFVVAGEDFVSLSQQKGYTKQQILPFGIPVDEKTLEEIDKTQARKLLGIKQDAFTIMIMFGGGLWSGGLKIFKQVVRALKGRQAQIIMINGKNKKSFEAISKMKFEPGIDVVNVGFTNQIPLYLSAADLILNKCGGASAPEMINKHLPMLITEKLAAQEKHNLAYLKSKGIALSFKNEKQLKENLLMMMDNKKLLQSMSKATNLLRQDSIKLLAEFIMQQPNADYTALEKQDIDFDKVKKTVNKARHEANRRQKKLQRAKA